MAYERLRAWTLAHQLVLGVYRATRGWPSEERYGLTSQVRRAAVSVAAALAEGAAKRGAGDYRRFVDIALGSVSEVAYLLRLAHELDLLDSSAYAALDDLRKRTGGLIWRLARALDQSRP